MPPWEKYQNTSPNTGPWAKYATPTPEAVTPEESDSFLGEMGQNFENAIKSAGDLFSGNYQDIGRTSPTPKTQALADKLFPPGSEGTFTDAISNLGNTAPSDWSGALLEKFGETPEGKALSVIGGVHPVFNAVGTTVNRYVNPAITDATGIHPDNLLLAEMVAGTAGLGKARTAKDPALQLAKAAANKVTSAFKPPINEGLRDVAGLAGKYEIPLSLDQVSSSRALKNVQKVSQELPFSGRAGFREKQLSAFNKALMNTVGENSTLITPEVMDKAFTRVGAEFDKLGQGKAFSLKNSGFNKAIAEIKADARGAAATKEAIASFDYLVKEIKNNAVNGQISGEKLGTLRNKINRLARKSNSQDARELLHDLENAVVDTMTFGDDAAKGALSKAKQQYKNLLVLEPLAQKAKGGNISPSLLQNRVAKIYGRQYTRGNAGEIGDLARVGHELLPELGGSDTMQKAAYFGGAAGGVLNAPVTTAALLGGNRIFQSGINRNQALIRQALKGTKGEPVPLGDIPAAATIGGVETMKAPAGGQPIRPNEPLRIRISPDKRSDTGNPLLDRIAQAESGGNPNAKASTSSASGLFQFTDPTWKSMVRKYGNQFGIKMQDKADPEAQRVMAQALVDEHTEALSRVLGREPTDGELYLAHFAGSGGAKRLLKAPGTAPAAKLLPKAAQANRRIFYDGNRQRTVSEVIELLSSKVA